MIPHAYAPETTYIAPLATIAIAQRGATIWTAWHLTAFGGLVASLVVGMYYLALGCAAVCVLVGAHAARAKRTMLTSATVLLSPSAYVTAWPLLTDPDVAMRFVGGVMVAVHVVTAGGAVVLSAAAPMHKAWGCYPPSTPVSEYKHGMCGSSNPRWFPPAGDVCDQPGVPQDCSAQLTPYKFFGSLFNFVVHAQTIALVAWLVAGYILITKPRPQQGGAMASIVQPKPFNKYI